MNGQHNGDNVPAPIKRKLGDIFDPDTPLAPLDTLHGQIQRGRGQGFLRALQETPATVHALLFDCMIHEHRIDRQCEHRTYYYAHLADATQMDLAPLEGHLRTFRHDPDDWRAWLAIQTLGSLAHLGNAAAVTILRQYISYGTRWDVALQELAQLADPAATGGLADSLCVRFATGEQMAAGLDPYSIRNADRDSLLHSWRATHPGIARLFTEAEAYWAVRTWHASRSEVDYSAFSTRELLATTGGRGTMPIERILLARCNLADVNEYATAFTTDNYLAWRAAFQCLVILDAAAPFYDLILHKLLTYVAAANEITMRGHRPSVIGRILQQLPAEMTLPSARRWFDAPEWYLCKMGEDILEAQATLDDIPQMRVALARDLAGTNPYDRFHIGVALNILKRFPDCGVLPEVDAAFVQTDYSWVRCRAAHTMQVNAPAAFAATYAYECLWDCEEETRRIGCESVPLTVPGARERLHVMAADPLEDELVKEAIAKRIAI